jgi:hypothetical protein
MSVTGRTDPCDQCHANRIIRAETKLYANERLFGQSASFILPGKDWGSSSGDVRVANCPKSPICLLLVETAARAFAPRAYFPRYHSTVRCNPSSKFTTVL